MNRNRIFLGGLVAGLVLVVGDGATELLIGSGVEGWLSELGLPRPGEAAVAGYVAMAFTLGILAVWLYAAIRPRYGAGPRTAVIAGVAVWALNCLFPSLGLLLFGALSAGLFWSFTLVPLVLVPLATLAGARVYSEPGASVARASGTAPASAV